MPAPQRAPQQRDQRKEEKRTTYEDVSDGYVSGNLTRDPELRFTPAGAAVATLRVAETAREQDQETGQWHDGKTEFYDVVAWSAMASNAAEDLLKGDRIVAVGRWQKQSWQDDQGEQRSKLVLVARDLGPSMLFVRARPARPQKRGRQ